MNNSIVSRLNKKTFKSISLLQPGELPTGKGRVQAQRTYSLQSVESVDVELQTWRADYEVIRSFDLRGGQYL